MPKAIVLVSGGLDSILAARLIREQGIEIIPLKFKIPFFPKEGDKINQADWYQDFLGCELQRVDISQEFLGILKNPTYGFGSNLNPCIDCKIFMLSKAKELMRQWDAAFVATGEVLGQRPMSQGRQSLELIEKKSGLQGSLLRPLSAQLLVPTVAEIEGWVNRHRLLGISGRSRKPQIELARRFSLKEYPNAAGGCLLTDPGFSGRLKDLIKHKELSLENIELLKIGRHFRVSSQAKLVLGRNEKENGELHALAREGDYLFYPRDIPGPTALGRGIFPEELLRLCCNITCRYCDLNGKIYGTICYHKLADSEERSLNAIAASDADFISFRI